MFWKYLSFNFNVVNIYRYNPHVQRLFSVLDNFSGYDIALSSKSVKIVPLACFIKYVLNQDLFTISLLSLSYKPLVSPALAFERASYPVSRLWLLCPCYPFTNWQMHLHKYKSDHVIHPLRLPGASHLTQTKTFHLLIFSCHSLPSSFHSSCAIFSISPQLNHTVPPLAFLFYAHWIVWNALLLDTYMAHYRPSFRSLFRCHFMSEAFLTTEYKVATTLLPISFMLVFLYSIF